MFGLLGILTRLALKGILVDLYFKKRLDINSFRHLTLYNISFSFLIVLFTTTIIFHIYMPYGQIIAITGLSLLGAIKDIFGNLLEYRVINVPKYFSFSNIRKVIRYWLNILYIDNMYISSPIKGTTHPTVNTMDGGGNQANPVVPENTVITGV